MKFHPSLKILRALLGLGLLALVFSKLNLIDVTHTFRQTATNYPWLLTGVLMIFLGLFTGVIRWFRLLKALHISFPFSSTLKIVYIGQFFNIFMPGACGGDLLRAYYISKDCPSGQRVQAAATVLADRLIGLFTLIFFGVLLIACRLKFFLQQTETRIAGLLMLVFLLLSFGGLLVFFSFNLFDRISFFQRLEQRFHVGILIRRAYEALYQFRSNPQALVEAMIYSLINTFFLALAIACFGKSLNLDLPIIDYFTMFPIITILSSIPITPGALGIREGLFLTMFSAMGVEYSQAFSLSLLTYLSGVVWGLFGWFLFIAHSSDASVSLREEFTKLREEKKENASGD